MHLQMYTCEQKADGYCVLLCLWISSASAVAGFSFLAVRRPTKGSPGTREAGREKDCLSAVRNVTSPISVNAPTVSRTQEMPRVQAGLKEEDLMLLLTLSGRPTPLKDIPMGPEHLGSIQGLHKQQSEMLSL